MEQENINIINDMLKVDVDKAWGNLKNRIENEKNKNIINRQTKSFNSLIRIAAVLVIGISMITGVFMYIRNNNSLNTLTSASNENRSVNLPDGSTVEMNSSSKLIYAGVFKGNEREVKLEGEAYFKVTPDELKPFIVKTKKINVKVVGTSFNVLARNNNNIEVFVVEGKVKIFTGTNEENAVILAPGKVGIFNGENIIVKDNENINYLSWKTKKIEFNNTSLQDVVKSLNRIFNSQIEIKDKSLDGLKYTSTIINQPFDKIIEAIQYSFINEIIISKEENKVVIDKK